MFNLSFSSVYFKYSNISFPEPTKSLTTPVTSSTTTRAILNNTIQIKKTTIDTTTEQSTLDYSFNTESTTGESFDNFYSNEELSTTESSLTIKPTVLSGTIKLSVSLIIK